MEKSQRRTEILSVTFFLRTLPVTVAARPCVTVDIVVGATTLALVIKGKVADDRLEYF